MRKSIIVRSSSSVMTRMTMVKKTRCGKISSHSSQILFFFFGHHSKGSWSNFNPLLFRTEWERERDREIQRDCQSSLSSGEASYPQDGPEESYSYQHHHHEPPRKTNGRYISTDAPVTTLYILFFYFHPSHLRLLV